MSWTYLLDRAEKKVLSFLLDEKGHAVQIRADDFEKKPEVGDIFLGRVSNMTQRINAAFVEYLPGQQGYLSLEDAEDAVFVRKGAAERIQQGDELLVQIKKLAEGSKKPVLTGKLTLSGNLAVLDAANPAFGVSKKICAEKRRELQQLAEQLSGSRFGVVLRTNAAHAREGDIIREKARLEETFTQLLKKAQYMPCPCTVHEKSPMWLQRLESLPADDGCILTEDQEIYSMARDFLAKENPVLAGALRLYEDAQWPMRSCYRLEHALHEATAKKVWLDSGAWLVIEKTEALVSIDVNSGKASYGRNRAGREKMVLSINMEAAEQIARQLRLRNLSGIIIIDFINLEEEEHRQQLLAYLRSLLKNDPLHADAVDYTKLHLVEVTRKRTDLPLSSSLGEQFRYNN